MNTIQLGAIGLGETPTMAKDVEAALANASPDETLFVDIHSEGGSVFEGFAIYNVLNEWPGKKVARIKVAAFSIASYIAMACDEIEIANNGFFMIHNPYSQTGGDDADHAREAELLASLKASMIEAYSARTGLDQEQIKGMMADESYIGAATAVELGMADKIIESTKPKRQLPKNHLPTLVLASMYGKPSVEPIQAPTKEPEMSKDNQKPVAASVQAIKAAFPKASSEFIVKCMEEDLAMEDVGEEYAKAMEDENEELKAQLAKAMEEIEALKAKAMENEEYPEPVPAAAGGVDPVANAGESDSEDPKAEFESLVESFIAKGKSRTQAVIAANRHRPQLRQAIVAQANLN